MLALCASDPGRSRGRRFAEEQAPTRNAFQRDRDRIVHSTAFRRLVYKTQVFANHEGDLFRSRLTHSLEVAQLGRSIARTLQVNEDLVEAVALAHDLGHTPFGHAGQRALNECMVDFGGFEHNYQSLRVVDSLEQRYPQFNGLNLCFETREGILKHCNRERAAAIEADEPRYSDGAGGIGQRFLQGTQPSLEAQLCNLADEIAYNTHDIDDGIRSGLIDLAGLRSVPWIDVLCEKILQQHPQLSAPQQQRRLVYELVRVLLSTMVYDVIEATQHALRSTGVQSVNDVRACERPLACFSPDIRSASRHLKAYLFAQLYRHPKVVATMDAAEKVIHKLFASYVDKPEEMKGSLADERPWEHDGLLQRHVADYIAGMTDRFAAREHERLTGQRVFAGLEIV
ncbi:deoxyguanosinetriphosphate triphosphohydrolase [Curvibacter sp. CHRR-16]|uniref:deoxyguanosinetriphosphate triphosphohydrolase n=1 Tax=Curvibacter sp. CHRR-16 TaxID=2835872 RepID=UPI001BDAB3AB|nr:deoxyguanosinetriphosphate triphosphohydrolase [Curvibacter sp. CHRR-16]MBT0569451.1 deoxyguanosinetriphosphate triphosphohydrolase [Curvibacter sp. CHRR-16]